jgi:hypothetical protein
MIGRIFYFLLNLNLYSFAFGGLILFVVGALMMSGILPNDSNLSMMGQPVESADQYFQWLVLTGSFSTLGWLYVWLVHTKRLVFRDL